MKPRRWKGVQLRYDTQGETALYELNPAQVNALLALSEFTGWRTRWETPPPNLDVFSSDLRYALMNPIDICEVVADCISTSDSVQSAIQKVLNTTTEINEGNRYSNQVVITGDADDNGCGNDAKFGRIVALVDYVDTVQLDFFQAIDAALNIVEQISEIVAAIPLFETLPFDELISSVGGTGENWRDSYEASVNTQLLEDFYCEMWCEYGEASCDITVDDMLSLIKDRYNLTTTTGQLNVLSAGAVLSRLAVTITAGGGGTYIGDDFVYLSWLLQLGAQSLTGQFFGVDLVDYARESSNGSPDNSWSSCACSDAWSYTFDFCNLPSVASVTQGSINASCELQSTTLDGGTWRGTMIVTLSSAARFTYISATGNVKAVGGLRGIYAVDQNNPPAFAFDNRTDDGDVSIDQAIDVTTDSLRFTVDGSGSGSVWKTLTLEGVGLNPFI